MKATNLMVLFIALSLAACNKNASNDQAKTPEPKYDCQLTQAEISGHRLTPEILWKFKRLSDPVVSPNKTKVLYGLSVYDVPTNKHKTNIYIQDAKSNKSELLANLDGSQFNQRWLDDNTVAFIWAHNKDAQVYKIKLGEKTPIQITKFSEPINSFEFSPDKTKILFTSEVKVTKDLSDEYKDLPLANVISTDKLMYRHWDHWNDTKFSHIFVGNIEGGRCENPIDIMPNEAWDAPLSPYFDYAEMSWSPDSKLIAYTCRKQIGRDYATSTNSDIYVYNTADKTTKNITKQNLGYDKYPVFSNDSKFIAYQSMETPGYESDKSRLMLVELSSGNVQYLTKDFDQNVSNIHWTKDDKYLYFISGIHATFQIYKMNLATKQITQITHGDHDYQTFQFMGDKLLGMKMKHSMASELFTIDSEGNETQFSFINKNIYDNITMGKSEKRWVTTTDGKKMLVWVILPPNFDKNKKYPALLYCQGGPQSAVSQFFSYRWNFQMMVANDYIVIAPNRRGLPTFGQEWNAQISTDYYGQNIKDYLSAVDEIKKEPYVDENRLGAVGASYGGYSVYYLAGHHNGRFKAFIAHCGMFNFESFYASTEETFFPNHDFGGSYWDKNNKIAQASYAHSPHKFVQNWDTPIMIITGGHDFRIPYTESLQAFNAARLRGIPAKLLFFPEESHFVVKPQNSILWQREFFKWLDKYLK